MSLALPRLSRARVPHLRLLRPFSSTPTRYSPSPVPSIPYTESCPAPTCACAPAPADLDIDRTTPLLNTMAPYAEQVLLCTGKEDWASNLEDEGGATAEFVKGMKGVIGRGGVAFDPFTNILLTASSLPASEQKDSTTAYLFPSFLRIPNIPHSHAAYRALASAYLSAESLHPMHAALSASQKKKITRDTAQARLLPPAERVTESVILICGHGGRDRRCGVLGPLLQDQFRAELARRGVHAQVALISHIGGHKYAGNVVVYLPPGWRANESKMSESKMSESKMSESKMSESKMSESKTSESTTSNSTTSESQISALQGSGIWYGRVSPSEVEGVIEETLIRGRVVGEMLRGGVVQGGGDIGRMVEAQRKKREGGEEEEGRLRLRPRARAGSGVRA